MNSLTSPTRISATLMQTSSERTAQETTYQGLGEEGRGFVY